MTCLDQFNNLLSKAEAASAFARSKAMKSLMRMERCGLRAFENKFEIAVGCTIVVNMVAFVVIKMNQISLSPIMALPHILLSVGLPVGFAFAAHWWFKKYEKQAQDAGVYIFAKSNDTPSAATKMRIVDAYEASDLPREQIAVLKSIAQRDDVPLGWWESVGQLMDEYRENRLHNERTQKHQEYEQHAERRLAALATVEGRVNPQRDNYDLHTQERFEELVAAPNEAEIAQGKRGGPPRLLLIRGGRENSRA